MQTEDSKSQGETKWNNHQELNEGFSTHNIPDNYDPSQEDVENRLKPEVETRKDGSTEVVDRARFPDDAPQQDAPAGFEGDDNRVIENRQSLQNRDLNYDLDPERYPPSHPDNHEHRGNVDK